MWRQRSRNAHTNEQITFTILDPGFGRDQESGRTSLSQFRPVCARVQSPDLATVGRGAVTVTALAFLFALLRCRVSPPGAADQLAAPHDLTKTRNLNGRNRVAAGGRKDVPDRLQAARSRARDSTYASARLATPTSEGRRPTSSDWASDVLLESVWQAIKRGDESGVAYCPRLRRQHREGVAGMWRFTAATST